jgi:hypothetical protein
MIIFFISLLNKILGRDMGIGFFSKINECFRISEFRSLRAGTFFHGSE